MVLPTSTPPPTPTQGSQATPPQTGILMRHYLTTNVTIGWFVCAKAVLENMLCSCVVRSCGKPGGTSPGKVSKYELLWFNFRYAHNYSSLALFLTRSSTKQKKKQHLSHFSRHTCTLCPVLHLHKYNLFMSLGIGQNVSCAVGDFA